MNPNDAQLSELARLLAKTTDCEIDCGEFLDHVAAYLEALTDKSAISPQFRQVTQHLSICPECQEEFDALVRAEGMDPAAFRGGGESTDAS